MELSDKQIYLLQIIHDSNNHCVSDNDLTRLKIDFPAFENELQMFIEMDFVEYELKENKYYLAYEGFEILENKNKTKLIRKTGVEQYEEIVKSFGGAKQFQRITLFVVLIVTIFISIFLYLNPEIEDNFGTDSKFDNIDESILNDLKIQIQERIDSIKNLEKTELKEIEN